MIEKYSILNSSEIERLNLHKPDKCPVCHCKINPEFHMGYIFSFDYSKKYRIVFTCPNEHCLELFIGYYAERGANFPKSIVFQGCEPSVDELEDFSEKIKEISPSFVEIYNQSLVAENNKLDEICGLGFRKSMEFLIKDYLVYKNPELKDKILSDHRLANVIETYVDDRKIKDMVHRAAWLGNDQAHYLKKWSDKDVEDLKILIKTALFWIQAELEYEHYISEMK